MPPRARYLRTSWCVHVASLVGVAVGVNQRRALLLVRPSVRPLVSLDLYIVLPIESPRTHSAYYAHAIRRARSPTRRKQASMNTNRRSGPRRPPASARRSQHQAVSLKGPSHLGDFEASLSTPHGIHLHSSQHASRATSGLQRCSTHRLLACTHTCGGCVLPRHATSHNEIAALHSSTERMRASSAARHVLREAPALC